MKFPWQGQELHRDFANGGDGLPLVEEVECYRRKSIVYTLSVVQLCAVPREALRVTRQSHSDSA